MPLFKTFLPLLILLMSFTACQSTEPEESRKWTENISRIKKLKIRYKAFAPVLEEILKEGWVAHGEAEKIKEIEKKTEALVKANNVLNDPFVESLSQVGEHTAKIRSLLTEIRKMKAGEKDRVQVVQVSKQAREALKFSRITLAKKENNDQDAADANLEKILEKLKVAERDLDHRKKTILSRPAQEADDK